MAKVASSATLSKDHLNTVEYNIAPPLGVAITLPVEGGEYDGMVVYVGVSAFADPSRDWARLVRRIAAALTLGEVKR